MTIYRKIYTGKNKRIKNYCDPCDNHVDEYDFCEECEVCIEHCKCDKTHPMEEIPNPFRMTTAEENQWKR